MAGADLNGDGWVDLIFGEGGSGPTIQVAFGSAPLTVTGPLRTESVKPRERVTHNGNTSREQGAEHDRTRYQF